MAKYGIWLSYNNQEEGFQIPVNPGSIEISESGQGKTYNIENLGEINVIKNPKLSEYAFSGIFPSTDYPFVSTDTLLTPKTYVDYILKWMATKMPIRFVFTGKSFDINEAVSIEKFDWKETAGRNGDIEYNLKLKKYVFYYPKKITLVQQSTTTITTPVIQKDKPKRANEKEIPETYTLVSGDTLWKVAKKILDDGSKWKEIQSHNDIPDSKLKSLSIGTVLKIPSANNGDVYNA